RHARIGHAVHLVDVLQADERLADPDVFGDQAHSTSPRRTPVTLVLNVARMANTREMPAAATTATANSATACQSVTRSGAGNPREMLGPSEGIIRRNSSTASTNAAINEKPTIATCSPIITHSIVRRSVPSARSVANSNRRRRCA